MRCMVVKGKRMRSLQELCVAKCADQVLYVCERIEAENGRYSEPSCVAAVENLKRRLLGSLGALINDVLEKTQHYRFKLKDARIIFALQLQKFLHSFAFSKGDVLSGSGVYEDKRFWQTHLGNLTSVRVLDLRYVVCTDDTMKVICKNCHELEVIRIQTGFSYLTYSGEVTSIELDGRITAIGVSKLLTLEHLRVVDDTCHFKSLSLDFLKRFFRVLLPRLENFTHQDLVHLVLNNMYGLESLKFTHLKVYNVKREYFMPILRLCPKLKHLQFKDLMYPMIFEDLSNSSLNISSLHMENLSRTFLASLLHYLKNKGNILTALVLESSESIVTVDEVLLIGKCCPNLTDLELNLAIRDTIFSRQKVFLAKATPFFKRLNKVTINGNVLGSGDYEVVKEYFYRLGSNSVTCYEQQGVRKEWLQIKY